MAAPRKYPEPAREAMFALYEEGIQPTEIARRCAQGLPGFGPFQIPRRTVADIVASIARKRGEADLPRRIDQVLDGPSEELAARYPKVVLGLINADAERLRRKIIHDKLTLGDYNRLRAAAALYRQITSRGPASRSSRRRDNRREAQAQGEGVLERLAREATERGELPGGDGQVSELKSTATRLPAHARGSELPPGRAEVTS